MRISDWSSDVCSSDLIVPRLEWGNSGKFQGEQVDGRHASAPFSGASHGFCSRTADGGGLRHGTGRPWRSPRYLCRRARRHPVGHRGQVPAASMAVARSEEHTSELQSLMRISYAVFCWKKKKQTII